jgi:putative membrane protein
MRSDPAMGNRIESEIFAMKKIMLLAAVAALALSLPAAAQETTLDDAQIAHIAYTAGAIDIKAAEQALSKSQNAAVVEFAQEMARDHQAVNDQALALVEKLGVTPEDNATSRVLNAQAEAKLAELDALDGKAFDTAYVANEVAFHHTVNTALSDTLIPGAQNAELKALLETGLTLFTAHEQHAEHVAAEIR